MALDAIDAIDAIEKLNHCAKLASGPEGLRGIHQPGTAAAIWTRTALRDFQRWIDALPPAQLPRARLIPTPEAMCNTLVEITRSCGMPDGPQRHLLIEDASALAP